MGTIDFARSYFTFRVDSEKKPPKTVTQKVPYSLNNARIPIEAALTVTAKDGGYREEFVLGVSCKTEQVGVEQGIWHIPNADFKPIFSSDTFMAIKTYEVADRGATLYPPTLGEQPERQIISIEETFDDVRIDLSRVDGNALASPRAIVEAVLGNVPLNARTTIENERYTAALEYPVKTINANERDWIYQPDTGPVLLPDLARDPEDMMEGIELAFAAFNTPDWVEFIVRVPTPVAEGVNVYHYAEPVRMDCVNEMLVPRV